MTDKATVEFMNVQNCIGYGTETYMESQITDIWTDQSQSYGKNCDDIIQ